MGCTKLQLVQSLEAGLDRPKRPHPFGGSVISTPLSMNSVTLCTSYLAVLNLLHLVVLESPEIFLNRVGSSRDEQESIRAFLGRDFSVEAYTTEQLGNGEDTKSSTVTESTPLEGEEGVDLDPEITANANANDAGDSPITDWAKTL